MSGVFLYFILFFGEGALEIETMSGNSPCTVPLEDLANWLSKLEDPGKFICG
jgi:hypothetical protein